MTVEKALKGMFCESVGHSMLDSGGAYGYNYDRNRKRYFKNEPDVFLEEEDNQLNLILVNTFKFLSEALWGYADELTNKIREYMQDNDCNEEDTVEAIGGVLLHKLENTYNYDTILDQTLEFLSFTFEDKTYVLIKLHQGCDVRGGYTEPYIFTFDPYEEMFCIDPQVVFWCDNNSEHTIKLNCEGYLHYEDSGKEFTESFKMKDGEVICPICHHKLIVGIY